MQEECVPFFALHLPHEQLPLRVVIPTGENELAFVSRWGVFHHVAGCAVEACEARLDRPTRF